MAGRYATWLWRRITKRQSPQILSYSEFSSHRRCSSFFCANFFLKFDRTIDFYALKKQRQPAAVVYMCLRRFEIFWEKG